MAAPNGTTLLLTSYADRRVLFGTAPPSAASRSLVPLVLVAKAPLVLVAHPQFVAASFSDFLVRARSAQGKLNYASIGNGTPSHLAMEKLQRAAEIELGRVPYMGSAQALADVIAGHVPVMFDSVFSASPHLKSGKQRAPAASTKSRIPTLPEVPTVAEGGVKDFDVFTWAVVYAPPDTSDHLADFLEMEIAKVVRPPDVEKTFAAQGAIIPPPMSRAEVAAFIREDVATWRQLISERKIAVE